MKVVHVIFSDMRSELLVDLRCYQTCAGVPIELCLESCVSLDQDR